MRATAKLFGGPCLCSTVLALIFLFALPTVSAQNLVTNPGFETGNLTGWTNGGAGSALVFCNNARFQAHSGSCAVSLTNSGFTTLSQSIATTPGTAYTFGFWLMQSAGEPAVESFSASWDGNVVFSLSQSGPMSYTNEVFMNLTATGTMTTIAFSGNGDTLERWVLDDVSVMVTRIAPTLTKTFSTTNGQLNPGDQSTLTFTLSNTNPVPLTGAAFTDALPAGLVVSTPPGTTNTCDGTVTAPADGNSISLSGGTIPANGSCTITVSVTNLAFNGTLTNTTSTLTTNEAPPGAAATATQFVSPEFFLWFFFSS